MPDGLDSARQPEADPSIVEVLETDSGRKPLWGILAVIGFLIFAVFSVWRVTAGDGNSPPSYSSSVSTTTVVREGNSATGNTDAARPRRDSTAARVFFFAMVGAMALVAARIIWGARRIYRATARRESKSPGATLN